MSSSITIPLSVIIPLFNQWAALDDCLRSLATQTDAPDFEVIVVDDGSSENAPQYIANAKRQFSLTILRQEHAGIGAARNRGIQISRGAILLFVDSDSRLQPSCLSTLFASTARYPVQHYFQLRLIGGGPGIMGKAEWLRLEALQQHLLRPEGGIRYLNTAGFAIRRDALSLDEGLFDTNARRAEDTLLLARLMKRGQLPFFVENAIVEHAIAMSFLQSLVKDVKSGVLEVQSYRRIAAMGIRIRMSSKDRLTLLHSMWRLSKRPSIGRQAWFALTFRQLSQRLASFVCTFLSK
jgi:GT2 family glycosyltransferase